MIQEPNNKIYKVKTMISGFTKEQVSKGLIDLLDEFENRPWLLETDAYFDETSNLLIIIAGYETDVQIEDRAFEEVSSCVIATMNFDKEINFHVEKI